ncbi:TetR/AcrR family transcriptional regulator [Ancylobacter sp. 6x-1]|uniref:TetR/AcrR family transcriptional regulator n=1 Tax=Ancylobacter crimeensis TaxID=2579147 RepID=A0ABT0DDG5_9HYPH|nr:TetR/AcrR family transcriptional regulator [Ancylobacter crimeensis]MCK0197988.1 TetR/AcrR family transcriptional regulator [Ancylobacter crimeensis]
MTAFRTASDIAGPAGAAPCAATCDGAAAPGDTVAGEMGALDSEKRRQILAGARNVFLALGFDAARMAEIARVAGVSKGTLYVYFTSKQELFSALVDEECHQTADRIYTAEDAGTVREGLTQIGRSYVAAMIRPEYIATLRIVIAIADRFPEISHQFLESGPAAGAARLAAWLTTRAARGELAALPDPELAAWQFLVGCHAPLVMPMLFGRSDAPGPERVEHVVSHMVGAFLRSWGSRPAT